MNLPNAITLSRLILTAAFIIFVAWESTWGHVTALILFLVAAASDYVDGWLARKMNLVTPLGKLLDPLADKILTCSAFIAFVELRQIEAWMVVIIVGRELAITGLRLLAASRNVVLAAEGFGKHKTISQIVAIIAVLVLISYQQWGPVGAYVFGWHLAGKPWIHGFTQLAQWVAVLLTVLSGSIYLWRNRHLYLNEV